MAELHHVEGIFRALASGGIARTIEVAVCLCVCPQVQMRGDTGRKAQGLCSGSALLILDSNSRAANLFGNHWCSVFLSTTGAQETQLSTQGVSTNNVCELLAPLHEYLVTYSDLNIVCECI